MNTTRLKVFQYIGNDDLIYNDMVAYFDDLDDFSDVKKIYQYVNTSKDSWKEEFINALEEGIPHIVYMDFCSQDTIPESLESISKVLLNYKKNIDFTNILVAGIFPSKEVLEEQKWMLFCGMNYVYIKSDKQSNMIYRDTRYMVLDNAVLFQDFAKASQINLNYFGHFPGLITNMDEDYLTIECDMTFCDGESMQIEFDLFEEFSVKSVKVCEMFETSAPRYYLMHKYISKIPYPEPFDDVEDDTLYRDTVETWLDNNREEICISRLPVLVIDNTMNHKNICKLLMDTGTDIEVSYRNKFRPTHDYFQANAPSIIFYNMDDEDEDDNKIKIDDGNDTLKLTEVIECICGNEGYLPFVVVFNCPSTNEAFQKVFKYPNIIVHPNIINLSTINMMIDLFKKKGRVKAFDDQCYMSVFNKTSWVGVLQDMYITSLTEHEITFLSKTELPLFSLIKMDIPCDLYITLVPPITSLDPQRGFFHYMGFINGVTEKDLEKLRRFVNQLIKNRPQAYEYLDEPEDETEEGAEGGEDGEVSVTKVDKPKAKKTEEKVVRAVVEKMNKDDIKSKL